MNPNAPTLSSLATGSVRERMMRVGLRIVRSETRGAADEPCIVLFPFAVVGTEPAAAASIHLKQEPMS